MPISRKLLAVVVVLFIVFILAVSFPITSPACFNLACFTIGPFTATQKGQNGTTSYPSAATGSIVIRFPGYVAFSDGSPPQPLTSAQNAWQQFIASFNTHPISTVHVEMQITSSANVNTTVTVSGFWDEVASRSRTQGLYFRAVSHNVVVNRTISVRGNNVTAALQVANVTHANNDLVGFGDSQNLTRLGSTFYNYAMVGRFNFTIGAPFNTFATAIFSWPNLPVTIGGTSNSRASIVVQTSLRYNDFLLGTVQTFNPNQANTSFLILVLLGLI